MISLRQQKTTKSYCNISQLFENHYVLDLTNLNISSYLACQPLYLKVINAPTYIKYIE